MNGTALRSFLFLSLKEGHLGLWSSWYQFSGLLPILRSGIDRMVLAHILGWKIVSKVILDHHWVRLLSCSLNWLFRTLFILLQVRREEDLLWRWVREGIIRVEMNSFQWTVSQALQGPDIRFALNWFYGLVLIGGLSFDLGILRSWLMFSQKLDWALAFFSRVVPVHQERIGPVGASWLVAFVMSWYKLRYINFFPRLAVLVPLGAQCFLDCLRWIPGRCFTRVSLRLGREVYWDVVG